MKDVQQDDVMLGIKMVVLVEKSGMQKESTGIIVLKPFNQS